VWLWWMYIRVHSHPLVNGQGRSSVDLCMIRAAHLDTSAVEWGITVLRRRDQQHILEETESRRLGQPIHEASLRILAVCEAKLVQRRRVLQFFKKPHTAVDNAAVQARACNVRKPEYPLA
jgi:hypothetical protein